MPTGDVSALASSDNSGARRPWHAIWTRSRAEKSVHDQLARKDIEVFLPTVRRLSRWKDRQKEIAWPLFPGYCFARFDTGRSLDVLKCAGVVHIIMEDGKPAPIRQEEIEAIQRLVETRYKFDPCPFIKEGDEVEVLAGPLKGVSGRLIRKGPNARLVLAITMINRAVAVTLDVVDVRRL
jgi:transcription antitermination factor NusG